MSEKEIVVDNTEDLKFSFFDIPDDGLSIPTDESEEDETEDEKVEPINEEEDKTDEESSEETEEEDEDEPEPVKEKEESDSDTLSEVDKTLAELVESGFLLLPEDYEYEDSKEGIQKAFEDSEKFRNQLAFREAINFLTSKEGLDLIKVREAAEDIEAMDNLDPETLEEDDKLKLIKYFYKEIKGFDEEDIDEMLENLIENDKIDKELNVASKQIKKHRQKELELEAERVQQEKENQKIQIAESQKLLKTKLEQDNINGYEIPKKSKDRVFEMIYKPVKTKDGSVTTEFNHKLAEVLSNPDTILVLADLLLNMDEKGFKFENLKNEIKKEAVTTTKKKLNELRQSGGKVKVSGGFSKSQSDFDLSKASLFSFK